MKKYFPYILTSLIGIFFAVQVLGSALSGTNVSAPIKPFDTNDTYPTHDARYGRGGYVQQPTTTARNAIPAFRRMTGMYVYVADQDKEYQLYNGTSNADWRERPGGTGSGHTIQDAAGNNKPARTYLRYSSPFQVSDSAGNNRTTVSVPEATTSASGLKSVKDKIKSDDYLDAKADFGCKGDGVTDDTTCIFTAISTARTANKPLKFRNGRFKTNGGYLINDPMTISGEQATFVLASNAILFDISVQQGFKADGFDVEVPDANTASVIRLSTTIDRNSGRGWGPHRGIRLSHMRLYSASARDWNPATGAGPTGIVNTKGSWTGIELWGDPTNSRTGLEYGSLSYISMEFPYVGIKTTNANPGSSNGTWFAGWQLNDITMHGFKTAYDFQGNSAFNTSVINTILHPLRDDGSIGFKCGGYFQRNVIHVETFHDSGWNGQTRGNYQAFQFDGSPRNIISGFWEDSVATPSTGLENNYVFGSNWVTDTDYWNSFQPNVAGTNGSSGTTNIISQLMTPTGIGTTPLASAGLHISKEYADNSSSNIAFALDTFNAIPRFMARRANGSKASPTATLSGDVLFAFGGRGFDGTNYPAYSQAQVQSYAAEDTTSTAQGAGLKFSVTSIGNTPAGSTSLPVYIYPSGNMHIGAASINDTGEKLKVDGAIKSSSGGFIFPDDTTQTTAVTQFSLPDQTGNSGKYLTTNGSSPSWATVAAGMELSRVVTGGQTAQSGDSVVEFTATGSYAIPQSLANKKSIVVSNSSASDIVSITAGSGVTLIGGSYSLLAGTFCVLGEDPNNLDTWRVVAVGSNSAAPDLSGYALLAGRASGQTLIGGTAAADDLVLQGTSGNAASTGQGNIVFKTGNNGGTTAATIDYQGYIGLGISAPVSIFHTEGSGAGSQWTLRNTAAASASASSVLLMQQNDSATPQATPSGSRLGLIGFGGNRDASHSISNGAAISAFAEGAWSSTSIPTYLTFNTAPSGSTTRTEKMRVTGAGLTYFSNGAGLPSGNMYSNTSTTITVAASGTWYEVDTGATDFTAGQLTGVTHSDHYLVVPVAGKYVISARGSAKSGAAGDEIAISIMVNGTASETCHGHTTASSATTTENIGCETILSLAANDQVSIAVQNHTAARNITITHGSLLMQHVAAQ